MAGGDFAKIFGTVLNRAETKSKEEQAKFEKGRDEDIEMYRKVLLDPNSSTDQRTKAAEQITKLRGVKSKGDSPFMKIAGFLNKIKEAKGQKQQANPQATPQAAPSQGQRQPMDEKLPDGTPSPQNQVPSLPTLKARPTLDEKVKPRTLPPIDASVFPTAAQQQKAQHVNQFKEFRDDFMEAFKREPNQSEIDTHFKLTPGMKIKEELKPDTQSSTGFSKVFVNELDGSEVSRTRDVAPPRSLTTSETDTTSTDPYGGTTTTHSRRRPVLPGIKPSQGKDGSKTPPKTLTPLKSSPEAGNGHPKASSGPSQVAVKQLSERGLDALGHVPPSPSVNPRVREMANQLLDGADVNKLPEKGREPAADLARKYGWQPGRFTPKEQVMLKEANTFLREASTNPALSVLDESFLDRAKLMQVVKNPDKEGYIGRGLSLLAAQNLSPQQQEFVRLYNQLVGTISGMAQLVRSGRATEATIERLKAELPNPVTTAGSDDARKRIERLLKEIDVALEKGSFEASARTESKSSSIPENPYSKKKTASPKAASPAPKSETGQPKKKLDDATALAILKEAGGDKDKARKLAKDRNYEF